MKSLRPFRILLLPALLLGTFAGTLCLAEDPEEDITPPKVYSIDFSPKVLDTTTGQKLITVTADVSDNKAGINYMDLTFYSPTTQQSSRVARLYPRAEDRFPKRGELDKRIVITGTLSFLPDHASGNWIPMYAYLYDNVGNWTLLSATAQNPSPLLKNLPPLNLTSNNDKSAPSLTSFTIITPGPFDVSTASASIVAELEITDVGSGVTTPDVSMFTVWGGPNAYQSQSRHAQLTLLNPAPNGAKQTTGRYRATFQMPRHSHPGTWSMYGTLYDAARNSASIPSKQVVVVSTNPDITGPQLTLLDLPAFILPTIKIGERGYANFSVRVSGIDDLSGLSPSPNSAIGCWPSITLSSQIGQSHFSYLNSETGDSNRMLATFSIPQYSQSGTWQPSITLCDKTGNSRSFNTAQSNLPPGTLLPFIMYPSNAKDGTINKDQPVTIRQPGPFPASISVDQDTYVTDQNNKSLASVDVALDLFDLECAATNCAHMPKFPLFDTYQSLLLSVVFQDAVGNVYPNAQVACGDGASGATLTVPLDPKMLPVDPSRKWNLFYIDKAKGSWQAQKDCKTGLDAEGVLTDGGQSVTFKHIAIFSVFLAAQLKKNAVVGDTNSDGTVDCADVTIVKAAFGKREGQPGFVSAADFNGDHVINIFDLTFILQRLPSGLKCP